MPKNDRPASPSDKDEISVRLKPILGVAPGRYLSVVYGVVLVLLVYLLLFLPGIRRRGSYFSITTFPDQATVTVDGVYAGSTPSTIFIGKGDRVVAITKPFYQTVTFDQPVRGRIFGTLLVRDRKSIYRSLAVKDPSGLLQWAAGDYQKNPEIPRIISDAAWAARGAGSPDQVFQFLAGAMSYVDQDTQVRELVLGAARAASRGSFLSPSSLVTLVQKSLQLTRSYDNLPAWILLSLSKTEAGKLSETPWVKSYADSYVKSLAPYVRPGAASGGSTGSVTIAGISFRGIPGGDLAMGQDDNPASLGTTLDRELLHPVRVAPFYLGTTEVTNRAYETFLAENPDWAPSNMPALISRGLVTDGYLAGWTGGKVPAGAADLPVTGVSWHAAVAFTDWLSRRVQGALPGYVARLPLESEWEWAARGGLRGSPYPLGGSPGNSVFAFKGITGPSAVGASEANGYGLRDMLGNVWEWCADSFNKTSYLLTSFDPRENAAIELALPVGPDRSVRGGGWGNQPGSDKVWTRGFQPADWSTPWLGFRVALARK